MNENAKKWVAALRSGEYKQGKDCLEKDGKNCCLGVACRVYQKEVGGLQIIECAYYSVEAYTQFNVQDALLASGVELCHGIRVNDGEYSGSSEVDDNDDVKRFDEIADII